MTPQLGVYCAGKEERKRGGTSSIYDINLEEIEAALKLFFLFTLIVKLVICLSSSLLIWSSK